MLLHDLIYWVANALKTRGNWLGQRHSTLYPSHIARSYYKQTTVVKTKKMKNKNKWQIVFWGSAMTTQVIGRKKGRGMRYLCHLIIQNYLDGLSFNSSLMCLFQLKTGNACLVQLSVSWQKDKRGNKKYLIMHLCTRRRTKKLNSTHKGNLNRGSNSARP